MRALISKKTAEVQQCSCVAELEKANTQLHTELAATYTKVMEVKRRERALTSDCGSLRSDFGDLQTAHAALVKEKANLGKVDHDKAQQFHNLLCKKLASLRYDMEESIASLRGWCLDFPATNATIYDMLEWFRMEVQALPTSFIESNENITCFVVAGVLKMLAGVECGHLPELKKFALSCDASLLHDVPDDLDKIAGKLVRNWWNKHALSYCM
jgi:hypothetical protein